MQIHRAKPVGAALAAAVIAGMSLSGCAAPQESEKARELTSSANAGNKAVDDKVTAYLQAHAVRASLLFDSVSRLLETLGETKARTIDECEYEPEFRDWEELVPGLRENTTVALLQSFTRGMNKVPASTEAPPVDSSFCAELNLRYSRILLDLKGLAPALRKQGY